RAAAMRRRSAPAPRPPRSSGSPRSRSWSSRRVRGPTIAPCTATRRCARPRRGSPGAREWPESGRSPPEGRRSFANEPARGRRRADRPGRYRAGAMGTIYAIANQKGGVGKTTTAVNVAACIAEAGYPTLLVDIDPQANATVGLGLAKDLEPNVYDVISGEARAEDALCESDIEGLSVLPSS